MPVLVLAGDEDFELYRRLDELKKEYVDPAWMSFNYARHESPTPHDVIELAAALPFGPGNKVLVLDRIDWFAKKRASKSDDTAAGAKKAAKAAAKNEVNEDALADALASVHPSTYLIFVSTSNFDSTLRLSKLVAKVAKVQEFKKEKIWPGQKNDKLQTWCQKEARRFDVTIDDAAASYLIDGLDGNLRQISSEMQKAAIFITPKTHITVDTLKLISPHHSHLFSVCDLWLQGNVAEAYAGLKELQAQQNNMMTIAGLQTIMSKWVDTRALIQYHNDQAGGPGVQRRELPDGELAKRISAETKAHPFAVEKDVKKLKNVPLQFLVDKRKQLTEVEALVKTGQMADTHALEIFFGREKAARKR